MSSETSAIYFMTLISARSGIALLVCSGRTNSDTGFALPTIFPLGAAGLSPATSTNYTEYTHRIALLDLQLSLYWTLIDPKPIAT